MCEFILLGKILQKLIESTFLQQLIHGCVGSAINPGKVIHGQEIYKSFTHFSHLGEITSIYHHLLIGNNIILVNVVPKATFWILVSQTALEYHNPS